MRVGVFPDTTKAPSFYHSLPHARGGVSTRKSANWMLPESSPCAWGCFYSHIFSISASRVFPMRVGVFLKLLSRSIYPPCLPHARGGVSKTGDYTKVVQ